MNIVFLCGFTPDSQKRFVKCNSIGALQNAADAHQRLLAEGLHDQVGSAFKVINLPLVGSFPRRFRRWYYPRAVDGYRWTRIDTFGFINIAGVKHLHRFFVALRQLIKYVDSDSWVIVYSAHLPFVLAGLLAKAYAKNAGVCLVVPDLPDHMGATTGLQGLLNKIGARVFRQIIPRYDAYVLLTQQMAYALQIPPDRFVVVEGISDPNQAGSCEEHRFHKLVLYSGTLAASFGVRNLVDAFRQVPDSDATLVLCGSGDSAEYIRASAAQDSRILFLGQIDRDEVKRIQRRATLLVNPRPATGEFTSYSFPSKVAEYMSSGRPVIMYRLPGIPDEYYDYCFTPPDETVTSLARTITSLLNTSSDQLDATGLRAREFMRSAKSPAMQGGKIVQLLDRQRT